VIRVTSGNTPFTLVLSIPQFSVVLKIFGQRKAAVVLQKVAESLRFDCGQYTVTSAVFVVYLRLSAVICGSGFSSVVEPAKNGGFKTHMSERV